MKFLSFSNSKYFAPKNVHVSATYNMYVTPHLITLSGVPQPTGYKLKILNILSNPAPTYIPSLISGHK